MALNLLDECKKYLPKFYKDGEWDDNPTIKFNNRYVDSEVIYFMASFFHFLVESSFLNKHAKYWLLSNMQSVRKAFEVYQDEVDEVDRVNMLTVQSDIRNSKARLHKYFEPNMLINVIAYPEEHLERVTNTLNGLIREYYNDIEYRGVLAINLGKEHIEKNLDDLKFLQLLGTIERYSKKHIEKVASLKTDELTKDMLGYYNYLISAKVLKAKDKERLKQLRRALGLGDINE